MSGQDEVAAVLVEVYRLMTSRPGQRPRPTPGPGKPPAPPASVPPVAELRKKQFYTRLWFWLAVVVAVAVVVIVVAAVSSGGDDATSKPHTVVYAVTGTGNVSTADISYYTSNASNRSSNVIADSQHLPWRRTITVTGDLSRFVLTANTAFTVSAKGALSCSLSVDGKVVSTDTSKGALGLVTCGARRRQ